MKESPIKVQLGILAFAAALSAMVVLSFAQAQMQVDPDLPEYQAVDGIAGILRSIGSDTMKSEMVLWTEGFTRFYPHVRPEIESKGSSSGPPALIAGTSQFAPMSRGMKAKEVNDFKKKYGYPPTALPTSIDMLAVYVHADNPIKGMTLQQVDAAFSRTRKGGYAKAVNTWGDLGLQGEWADKPITFYGRNAASGTNVFFREHALFNGAFRGEVNEQPDSASVVEAIAADKYGIGYSGIGFKTAQVRALPLAQDVKSEYVAAEPEHAYSGDYPLTRMLFLYVNYQPGSDLDPLRREFIRYLYSRQGQADVIRGGYLPIGNAIATRALTSVELIGRPARKPALAPVDTGAGASAAKTDDRPGPAAPMSNVQEIRSSTTCVGCRRQDRRRRLFAFPR